MAGSADSIALDGSSSDLSRQLYYRAKANESVLVRLNSVPDTVQNRLDDLRLDWSQLPGLAQLALLWDSGFAINPNYDAVQVWTLGDHTMSSLRTARNRTTRPWHCNGAQMNNAAKCIVEDFASDGSYHAAMWSIGGNSESAPTLRMIKHQWDDQGAKYEIMALHTVTSENEPGWEACPTSTMNGGYGSLVFPCWTTDNITAENEKQMKNVTGSQWVSEWLVTDYKDAAGTDSSGFNKLLLLPIILGALVIFALIGLMFYCKKKRQQKARSEYDATTTDLMATATYSGADQTIQFPAGYGAEFASGGSNTTLKVLLTSEYLIGKRIPPEHLSFENALSKGASGEVWVCEYAGQKVAAKRLLQTKENKAEDVHEFALEIELNAHLEHPNIGAFIGVAWGSLHNLTMVIEYFPLGDLQKYLKRNADLLTWARDKIHLAVGVARALDQSNRLWSELDNTMTAGVGTLFWTAPEILEGKRYSEQADIYSFGVVLSELDTCKIPFHDCAGSDGKKPKPFHILQEVMAGTLRPILCCQHDPSRRPSGAQLVEMLQGN
ncbi:protein kinase [Phytophthora infestans T30-4]|uniref:Protein kinase n=1 Tax=Phytophthora infestans (strain T30-4) TaxID=403677 RepID=D0NWQ6_PHYIT|nr:protein kinase [Phytophthora infestans T30-4]EEY67489.1 protein kinase [Phytophthora infestans T30-4]|eukprot:XP_002896462.1 protein kinase [Phytophthora infestans T30-4]